MTTPTLSDMFHRLFKPGEQTRAARSVEYFGWLDLTLGVIIFTIPYWAASLLRLPPLATQDGTYLHLVGVLVCALGMLYIFSGRANSEGFVVASLLDRPLVPVIMAVLYFKEILPGPLAVAFSISDFGGFLWTAFAWRADLRQGQNIGGPGLQGQTRAARSTELFGWLILVIGAITLLWPQWMHSLLQLPGFAVQGPNYFRLAGLLVGGLGMLYVVSGSLNAEGFVFASLLDRPIVTAMVLYLWWRGIVPATLATILCVADFGGFLWTLTAWRKDLRVGQNAGRVPVFARWSSAFFGFVSGVVRNSRTFHPDGRVFLGTVTPLETTEVSLSRAGAQLAGPVLMRIGMGVMKRGMPRWIADRIPDAPSIASRFFSGSADDAPTRCRSGEDLDLLSTAGGDRLWKLVINLATGGKKYGLHQFDYFQNVYYADVPYKIDQGKLAVWIRVVPDPAAAYANAMDGVAREAGLTKAAANQTPLRIEAQRVDYADAPFVAFAEIRFAKEIQLDQESLHFDPFTGRGFEPYGFFTDLRRSVYPAAFQSRPHSLPERKLREHESFGRLTRYLNEVPSAPLLGGVPAMTEPIAENATPVRKRRWVSIAWFVALAVVLLSVFYLAERFTRDRPVAYASDVDHFVHGSTGGEKMNGIPYWFWVALPELFPEYLPDKTAGRGYSSFGMIYPEGADRRYALPLGMSMRNYRGIDVVYLNCAACHIGTVRSAPGATPMVVPGMPAHQFNLGAWGTFLTTIIKDQKFTSQRLLDQIDAMQDDPHRVIAKPDLLNRLIFKYYAAYVMREKLTVLGQRLGFINTATWGPGRVDTFNAPKALLNFPMDKAERKELMGNVDFPSVWNQLPRKGMQLHWDGNNTSVDERNLSASFGTGAYPPILDTEGVLRMAKYLETAQPPAYPYGVNQALAAKGAPVYKEYCAGCHGTREAPYRSNPSRGDELVGTVVPIAKIGTDRSRLDSYTWLLAVNQSTLYAGYERDWGFDPPYPQRFSHFRKTQGYANMPLDGIWLRAPYLHNGAVPNLRELLEPASARSKVFYRGNDVYDPLNIGFVSNVPAQDGHKFYTLDTTQWGNGNQGHEGEAYGTNLPAIEKQALLEYLKTF